MKKTYLTFIAIVLLINLSYAQWSTGAGTIFPTTITDKLGIGTTSPSIGLTVEQDNGNGWASLTRGSSTYAGLLIGSQSADYIRLAGIGSDLGTYKNIALNPSGGNVGIGTTLPSAKLDVAGNAYVQGGTVWLGSDAATTGFGTIYASGHNLGGGNVMLYQDTHATLPSGIQFRNNSTAAMTILANGSVGIGTASPDEALTVNGTLHSKEVRVDMGILPDYVFKPAYRLPKLTEVKSYIDAYHHLPEMPSAAEAKANGLNLGKMNARLLKKVEELTLYLIQQKEQSDAQKKQLTEQQKINQSLQRQINNLRDKNVSRPPAKH